MIPPDLDLRARMRALALLDAILMPEWQFRYFSYDYEWGRGEEMGSMRDGQGDELFAHFGPAGIFVVGQNHETPANPAVFDGLPPEFVPSRDEPAFSTQYANLCLWRPTNGHWTHAQTAQAEDLLALIVGTPADYADWAEEYYEQDVDRAAVEAIFAGTPPTDALVQALAPGRTLADLKQDLPPTGGG